MRWWTASAVDILAADDRTLSLKECTFLADKGYDAKRIYNTVRSVYAGEAFILLNMRGTKAGKAIPATQQNPSDVLPDI